MLSSNRWTSDDYGDGCFEAQDTEIASIFYRTHQQVDAWLHQLATVMRLASVWGSPWGPCHDEGKGKCLGIQGMKRCISAWAAPARSPLLSRSSCRGAQGGRGTRKGSALHSWAPTAGGADFDLVFNEKALRSHLGLLFFEVFFRHCFGTTGGGGGMRVGLSPLPLEAAASPVVVAAYAVPIARISLGIQPSGLSGARPG